MSEIIDILIVEDNTIDRIIAERILHKEANFQVQFANTLSQALEMMDKNDFNAILLDLNLPDSQGVSTFETIHAKRKDIPVIVLTGTDDRYTTLEILRKGGQDFINKKNIVRHSLTESVIFSIERNKAIQSETKIEENT